MASGTSRTRSIGAFHPHEIGQFEPAFKAAIGDSDMDQFRPVLVLFAFLALHNQQVLLRSDINILRSEPGNGERDAVIIFAPARDVERRVIITRIQARLIFQQVEHTVKTNGAAAIGGKIKT